MEQIFFQSYWLFFLYHEEPNLILTQYKEADHRKVSVLTNNNNKTKPWVKDLVKLIRSLIIWGFKIFSSSLKTLSKICPSRI